VPVCRDNFLDELNKRCPKSENTKRGIATPSIYTIMTRIRSNDTARVAARVAIVASIGPAHGVHTTPSDNPVRSPPRNPEFPDPDEGENLLLNFDTAPSK